MRDIKFRAWDRVYKRMVDLDDCGLFMWLDGGLGEVDPACWDGGCSTGIDGNFVLMQYTGLKDKNGVEIYEGDVVGGFPHGTVYVRWCEKYACFESVGVDDDGTALFANDLESCYDEWRVIGNIYENPELIGDTNDKN